MIFIAQELKRQKINIPLLIGGATTSKAHTAVKIAPELNTPVVHVNDASRAVTVAGSLLNKKTSIVYKQTIRKEYEDFRNKFLQRQVKKELINIKSARRNKIKLNCDCLGISGGWTPMVHMHTQSGGKLDFKNDDHVFIPKENDNDQISIGACNGDFDFL